MNVSCTIHLRGARDGLLDAFTQFRYHNHPFFSFHTKALKKSIKTRHAERASSSLPFEGGNLSSSNFYRISRCDKPGAMRVGVTLERHRHRWASKHTLVISHNWAGCKVDESVFKVGVGGKILWNNIFARKTVNLRNLWGFFSSRLAAFSDCVCVGGFGNKKYQKRQIFLSEKEKKA